MASAVERRRVWARHVERFAGSGLSRRQYCARHDLAPATLDYWRRRLRAAPAPTFVPVRPRVGISTEVPMAGAFALQLCVGDARLTLPGGVDATWLASLLRALR